MRGRVKLSVVVLVVMAVWGALAQPPPDALVVRIARVVDGDTAILMKSHEYVRYLGINTPETGEPYYYVATKVNRDLVLRKDVYLEFGPQRRDGYGRLLAYLWVQRDGGWILVNEELLRRGVAGLCVFWPSEEKYYDRFLRAVTLAQVEKLGIWGRYKEPVPLEVLEDDLLPYITQAVTVVFTVERVERDEDRWIVWAVESRYGFHVNVIQEVWERLGLSPEELVGQMVSVGGELRWENLFQGPRIEVVIPEQWDTPK